jgi:hypothetical protein
MLPFSWRSPDFTFWGIEDDDPAASALAPRADSPNQTKWLSAGLRLARAKPVWIANSLPLVSRGRKKSSSNGC